ncbi:MAG: hypothetical protein JKY22_05450 [Flavobacteriaceae bacterium]|nr:hypothetical protein [Flavobacteriaceae bacterium]
MVRLNKETGETNIYFKKDGLPNNEFNKKSFHKVSNDSLLFGGISGLVSFNPEKIENENRDHNLFLAQVIM